MLVLVLHLRNDKSGRGRVGLLLRLMRRLSLMTMLKLLVLMLMAQWAIVSSSDGRPGEEFEVEACAEEKGDDAEGEVEDESCCLGIC